MTDHIEEAIDRLGKAARMRRQRERDSAGAVWRARFAARMLAAHDRIRTWRQWCALVRLSPGRYVIKRNAADIAGACALYDAKRLAADPIWAKLSPIETLPVWRAPK